MIYVCMYDDDNAYMVAFINDQRSLIIDRYMMQIRYKMSI